MKDIRLVLKEVKGHFDYSLLEKYRVIPSAEEWKEIRKLRNEFIHIKKILKILELLKV